MTVRARTLAVFVLACVGGAMSAAPAAAAPRTAVVRPLSPALGTQLAAGRTQPRTSSSRAGTAPPLGAAGTGLHWLLAPGQRTLVVEVVDTTGARWPVRAASRAWATAHVRVETVRSCRPGAPCVVVQEHPYGQTGWVGLTSATAGQMGTFRSPVVVQLNDSYPLTAVENQAVACHELGHALGLAHSTSATSCLQPTPRSPGPDSNDRTQLERMYGPGPATS